MTSFFPQLLSPPLPKILFDSVIISPGTGPVIRCLACLPLPPCPTKIQKHVRTHTRVRTHCHLCPGVWAKACSRQRCENMSPHIHLLGGHFSLFSLSKPEQRGRHKAVKRLSSKFNGNLFDTALHQQRRAVTRAGHRIHLSDFSLSTKTMSPRQTDPTPQLQKLQHLARIGGTGTHRQCKPSKTDTEMYPHTPPPQESI